MKPRSMLTTLLAAMMGVALSAQAPPAAGTVQGDAARRVDDYLTRLVPYGFSGAVLVAREGQVILEKGYGLADREGKRPYTADMVSCIGSVTKQ